MKIKKQMLKDIYSAVVCIGFNNTGSDEYDVVMGEIVANYFTDEEREVLMEQGEEARLYDMINDFVSNIQGWLLERTTDYDCIWEFIELADYEMELD